MPKIIINELDKTTSGKQSYPSFAVLTFGKVVEETAFEKISDELGVTKYPITDITDFEKNVGCQIDVESTCTGNQIAYELIKLGYPVYYCKLDAKVVSGSTVAETCSDKIDDPTSGDSAGLRLADKLKYDFRYILAGGYEGIDSTTTVSASILKLAQERKDCIAICDIDPATTYNSASYKSMLDKITAIESAANTIFGTTISGDESLNAGGTYGMAIAPYVTYKAGALGTKYTNCTFPGSFHYLACAAKAFKTYNEWYAVAGYTRGISPYMIESPDIVFGEEAVETLQKREVADTDATANAVNLIIQDNNVGYVLWGNRTGEVIDKTHGLRASHFLNIRQLCCSIKKQLYKVCKQFSYDPNSDVLWVNFCDKMRPLLEKMKADQGISDYKFIQVKDKTKAKMRAKIKIIPIEAVEDFEIDFYLEDAVVGTDLTVNENN